MATDPVSRPPASAADRTRRQDIIRDAEASLRLEGLTVDAETKALFARYVEGELTLAEVRSELDKMDARDFGRPIPLPRNKRS